MANTTFVPTAFTIKHIIQFIVFYEFRKNKYYKTIYQPISDNEYVAIKPLQTQYYKPKYLFLLNKKGVARKDIFVPRNGQIAGKDKIVKTCYKLFVINIFFYAAKFYIP